MKSVKRWPWLVVLICAPEILLPLVLGGAGFTLFSSTAVMGATLVLFGVGLGARLLWQRHSSSAQGLGRSTHHEAANR